MNETKVIMRRNPRPCKGDRRAEQDGLVVVVVHPLGEQQEEVEQ